MKKIVIVLIGILYMGCATQEKEYLLPNYQKWHTITLSFDGDETSETDDRNPFLDYILIVDFKHAESQYTVRGFYAADGNAAETSADSGAVWQVRFTPDKIGEWSYSASLYKGDRVALTEITEATEKVQLLDANGAFMVVPSTKAGSDFRAHGRLVNANGYFKFQGSDTYWLKGGADSPENLLAYEDFDGTYRMKAANRDGESKTDEKLHQYLPHVDDWKEGDPTWKGEKGKGLIGAVNYLSSKGMNVSYFLTMNIKGDGKDVWPYSNPDDFTRFDVSKLEQWEVVFQHMQSKGILLHMVLQETENETMLDGGDTGPMRQLYFQEMVARFGHHLGLKWNLGEENGFAQFTPIAQNDAQRKAMTDYLTKTDPYNHPILLHTHSHEPARANVLDSIVGFKNLDGLSMQVDKREGAAEVIRDWKKKSKEAGHPWMITMDEIGMWHTGVVPDSVDYDHDSIRRYVLWGTLLSGAAGVEWYYGGYNKYNDLNTEDWRTTDRLWELTDFALQFFQAHLPYWEMRPNTERVDSKEAYCFEKPGEVYAIYLPDTNAYSINLKDVKGDFSVEWFDPLEGGELGKGSIAQLAGGKETSLGTPPVKEEVKKNQDWVVLIKKVK
ncbi:MAG: DUF5060 domain-containing protein [Maribacter sp.]